MIFGSPFTLNDLMGLESMPGSVGTIYSGIPIEPEQSEIMGIPTNYVLIGGGIILALFLLKGRSK